MGCGCGGGCGGCGGGSTQMQMGATGPMRMQKTRIVPMRAYRPAQVAYPRGGLGQSSIGTDISTGAGILSQVTSLLTGTTPTYTPVASTSNLSSLMMPLLLIGGAYLLLRK